MAISTYAGLQSAVANWLTRSDLTAQIKEFIALAEARMFSEPRLNLRAMEVRSTASTVAGQRYYGLPTRYKQMRHVKLLTSPTTDLEYLTPERFDTLWAGSNTGKPVVYSVVGDEMELGPTPDAVYSIEMLFYQRFQALSDSNTSNWLLVNQPDLYLYGSLLEAEPYLRNDSRIQVWADFYDEAINRVIKQNSRDRHSGGALTIRPDFGVE